MKIKKQNITILLASLLILAATATVHSEEPGDKVLKQVTLDGKEVTMELIYQGITEYNPNGKIIYIKTQEKETWYEYNVQGNCIHEKGINFLEHLFEYEHWYEYDEQGKIITLRSKIEYWFVTVEYDSKGNPINRYVKDAYGEDVSEPLHYINEYDEKDNLIHIKGFYYSNDYYEIWYEYDENCNRIYEKHSNGNEKWYDIYGNVIHEKNVVKFKIPTELWYEYNEQGDCIYTKYVSELKTIFEGRYIYWYEYTYYPDGTVKTRKSYFDADFHQG